MNYKNRHTEEVITEACYLKLNVGARMKFDECYDKPTHVISEHNADDENDFSFTTALIIPPNTDFISTGGGGFRYKKPGRILSIAKKT